MAKVKVRRSDLKPGEVLCTYCTGRCCRYFALPIETPTTWGDFDHMRWYVMHGRTAIFVDGGTWYLLVFGDCQNLMEDNRCSIYNTRPQICRTYTTPVTTNILSHQISFGNMPKPYFRQSRNQGKKRENRTFRPCLCSVAESSTSGSLFNERQKHWIAMSIRVPHRSRIATFETDNNKIFQPQINTDPHR